MNKINVTLGDNESVLKWNDYSTALANLPANTLFTLAQRGFTHVMGNEVAAYESGLKTAAVGEGDAAAAKYSAAEIAVMVHDRRNEKLAEMAAGTLGYRAGGPRLPREERLTLEVAREHVVSAFHAAGRAKDMPKANNKKAWDEYVTGYLATPAGKAKVSAEVSRRMATPEVDADELSALIKNVTKKAKAA